MEEMGMADLQFKSFLKSVVSNLREIRKEATEPEVIKKLEEMIKRFESDIES